MRKYLFLTIITLLHISARGQTMPSLADLDLPSSIQAKSLRYWFDEDADNAKTIQANSNKLTIDASSLMDGLHSVHFQVIGGDGKCHHIASGLFMNMAVSTAAMKVLYWFDGETTPKESTVANGTQLIDVSNLGRGLHAVHYQLEKDGKRGNIASRLFFKDFDEVYEGANRIKKYQYYINDNSQMFESVSIDNAANPYQLTGLLPMPVSPIRTECFHFEVTGNVPTVYAKNKFHIRFYDQRGYFSDGYKTFVDYNVKQEVTNIVQLTSGENKVFDAPDNNDIAWFKVNALGGDSLTFCLNGPGTLQLFSASGEELYKAEGQAATKADGSFISEDGTYYVAVHDASSRYSRTRTLEYQHIDKYAVLRHTPNSFGVALSYIDVTLHGNGYDKLQSASLEMGANKIRAKYITASSKADAVLRFALTGDEAKGTYNLKLNFKDGVETEDLTVENAVKLSTAENAGFDVSIEQMMLATIPYPVIISVTNKSNVAKLFTPFNIAATLNEKESDAEVSLNECSWTGLYPLNFDVLAPEGYTFSEEPNYSPYTFTGDLFGNGVPGVVLHGFIPYIGPNETKQFIVGFMITSRISRFNMYAWTGNPLNEGYTDSGEETNIYSVWKYLEKYQELTGQPQSTRGLTRSSLDNMGDVLDVADQLHGKAASAGRLGAGIGLAIGSTVNGMRLRNIQAYTQDDWFAAEVLSDYEEGVRDRMVSPGQIADISGHGWLSKLLGLQQNQANCGNQRPKPHNVDAFTAFDPNDIYGYTSESGSKFMTKETKKVNYAIEFENDPEFATAAAHKIVITDVLDPSVFDLSTFKARNIKIGSKLIDLNGEKSFSKKTFDLRPTVNVIAQVSLSVNESIGETKWTIESLDPMTLEPTYNAYQGVLPVNTNGNGIGQVIFDVGLKPGLDDGDEVSNQASIVFDTQDAIETPVWTNTVDGVMPTSKVTAATTSDNTTATVTITASDNRSQPWRYSVYAKKDGSGDWHLAAENIAVDTPAKIAIEDGHNYSFYSIVTDQAGNVEQKTARVECALNSVSVAGDVNGNGFVDIGDAVTILNHLVGKASSTFVESAADVNNNRQIDIGDAVTIVNYLVGKTSQLGQ